MVLSKTEKNRHLMPLFLLMVVTVLNVSTETKRPTHLRISAHHFPPYQFLVRGPDGAWRYTGSTPAVAYWLAEKLKFTYTLVPVDEAEAAKVGSVQAGLNQIIRKEVDISTLSLVPTTDRAAFMDFSYPVAIESYKMITPKPTEKSRMYNVVQPFSPEVWATFGLSLVIISVVVSIFAMYYDCKRSTEHHSLLKAIGKKLSDTTIYILTTITNQGTYREIYSIAFRFLIGGWLLAAVVLVNSYSGLLMSAMTVPRFNKAIDTLDDLATSNELTMTMDVNSVLGITVLNATSGTYKMIGDAMRRNPESMYVNPAKGVANVFSMRYAFPTVESYMIFLVGNDLKKTGHCRFHCSDRIPITQSFTFGLMQGSNYNSLINHELMHLWESGLMNYWLKENLPKAEKCFAKRKEGALEVPIKLSHTVGIFFILGVGIGLGLLAFVGELIVWKRNELRRPSPAAAAQVAD